MHPAPSVILFTILSGLGFGLLFWLGFDPDPPSGGVGFAFFFTAFALAVGGLLASTFHLGHPERAWRAFSQWRTSWLSREGVLAVAALLVMGLYAAALVFLGQHLAMVGWLGGLLSLATVGATAMIYTQLKTVPRWNMPVTPVLFLVLSLAGGALLSGRVTIAIWLLAASGVVQVVYWSMGDRAFAASGSTLATATGLGNIGSVRAFEPPHTGTNYLMREMVFVVGRKHAQKLRMIALLLMVVVPVVFLMQPFGHVFAALAVLSHIAGVAASRWLFFAQAEHTVGLYYGKR